MALILTEQHGTTTIITLNRPERHNSLIPEFLREFLEVLSNIAHDASARAVILKANGRSFSTGGDVQGFMNHADTPENLERYAQELVGLLNDVMLAIMRLPVPVITCVQGIVTGGSLGLVLASDMVLISPEATFTPYYATVGFSPDGGWGTLLALAIGTKRAAELLLTDNTLTAEDAVSFGLANRIVPRTKLEEEALLLAERIAGKEAGGVAEAKRLLWRGIDDTASALEEERSRFVRQILTDEARTGMTKFLTT